MYDADIGLLPSSQQVPRCRDTEISVGRVLSIQVQQTRDSEGTFAIIGSTYQYESSIVCKVAQKVFCNIEESSARLRVACVVVGGAYLV